MSNLALLVPDGVGVRNFVLGPFLARASREYKVQLIHPISDSMVDDYRPVDAVDENISWEPILRHQERPLGMLLRQSLGNAQTYWINNFVMRYNRSRPVRGSWKTKTLHRLAKTIGYLCGGPRRMRLLDRLHERIVSDFPEVEHYRRLFEKNRPSVLFCSHQRPPQILAPVIAAKSLGIPTATFIFSWDNLTSKGRIAAPFDHYFVWSDLMRSELRRFYPEVDESRIHLVGTPQFDPYEDESLLWSREEFFARIGADPGRPLICYSGGDAGNVPADQFNVNALCELIQDGKVNGNPQVFVRPSPVDDGKRYEPYLEKFPDVFYGRPEWVHDLTGVAGKVMPSASDMQFLVNLVRHSSINVNFGSTMTLDYSIHDIPIINIAFDTEDPPVYGMNMWDYLQKFEHYQPVIQFGTAKFALSKQDLADHINSYLADPTQDAKGRKAFVDLEIGIPVGDSCEHILSALHQIGNSLPIRETAAVL